MSKTPGLPGLGLPGLGGPAAAPYPLQSAEQLLAQALQAEAAGKPLDAERLYRAALRLGPKDARIPAHLGSLLLEQGRHAEGAALMDQTLALDPNQPGMLMNRGAALVALGRFDEALASYAAAIALQPEPARAEAFNNLGVYLQGLKRFPEAVEAYGRALALDPAFPEAWGNRAISRLTLGEPALALADFDRALALKPDYADAWTNRGVALQELGRLDEALESFDRALGLDPHAGATWNNLSMALQSMGRYGESMEASVRAVELGGDDASDAWNNHGIALQTHNRFQEAVAAFDRSLARDPASSAALSNRGLALVGLGRHQEALAAFDAAIALDPGHADAHWNKAIALIALGRWAEGWPLFEWRWKRSEPGAPPPPDFGRPAWLGEPDLAGKTLLVWAEQGFGDTIQMLRFIPVLAGRGVAVRMVGQMGINELAATVEGLAAPPGPLPGPAPFDAHVPMMSLPLALGITPETVPAGAPYLSVPSEAAARWAGRLGPSTRKRVGLTWSGNPGHRNDHNRSLPLDKLLPVLGAGAEYHSLQKDYRPGDREAMAADGRIADHSADLDTFADTAALADLMDLVIAVDTSTAHLAGALGRPLLLMLPAVPDYRWGLEGETTPWYPTATLLRQDKPGDWIPVLDRVRQALA